MRATVLGLALVLWAGGSLHAQRFLPDDPITRDPDDLPVPKPAPVELSTAHDVIENTFLHRWPKKGPPAANVNTVGEVPDSSWFENRIGTRPLPVEELARGANKGEGPDVTRPWTVLSGKSQGITPGFTVRDARGDVYFVKFDPPEHPHLSTAAAVISARFFHAFGYHVPEDYITRFHPRDVLIGPDAKVSVPGGPKRRMVQKDLDQIFAKVARQPDGRIRAVASRRLPGQPLGPHKYHGTRPDDPNDLVPHEDRRELRGLRVFSAWLNHDDSRSLNSFDAYLGEPGQGHVKHYLIDFSSTLGAGSDALRRIAPQNPRAGNEYVIDWGPIAKAAFTLGLWERPWRKVRYAVFPEVGRLEAEFFEPHAWKPEYPNAAFVRMQPDDAFWAARIVSRFSDDDVRALVGVGEIDDPAAAAHLTQTLIRRRDKITARYFGEVNPLSGFRLEADALVFENLGAQRGLGTVSGYEYQWFAFDNASGVLQELGEPARVSAERIPRPATGVAYTMVRIRTHGEGRPQWRQAVDVFVRGGETPSVVGIDRE
jgi:hypothetical protein